MDMAPPESLTPNEAGSIDSSVVDGIASGVNKGQEIPETIKRPESNENEMLRRAELLADPRIMSSHPLSASEIVASIKSGNPVGLEHMTLGSSDIGEPIVIYLDDFGQVQHHKVTTAQWMGMKEARSLNRQRVAMHEEEKRLLNEKKDELRRPFETHLETVDDPLYATYLQRLFDENPDAAFEQVINDRRQSQLDEKKNLKTRNDQMRAQAWQTSQAKLQQLQSQNKNAMSNLERMTQQALSSNTDASADMANIRHEQRVVSLRQNAMTYSPTPQTAMLSPSEAYDPVQLKNLLASWLALPEVDRLVPHPSNTDYAAGMKNVFAALNNIASQIGWNKGFDAQNPNDIEAIESASLAYRNVHGEAMEIKRLEYENKKLLEQIKSLPSQDPILVPQLKEQHQQQTEDIAGKRSELERNRAMDTNNDGVVSDKERASFEEDVKSLETGREQVAAIKAKEEAELAASQEADKAEQLADLEKEMKLVEKDLFDLDKDFTSVTMDTMKTQWIDAGLKRMDLDPDFENQMKEKFRNLILKYDTGGDLDDKGRPKLDEEEMAKVFQEEDLIILELAKKRLEQQK